MSKKKKELANVKELSSFDTNDLIFELNSRGYTCLEDEEYVELLNDEENEETTSGFPVWFSIERSKAFGNELREHLLEITGQGHYATNEQLLTELRDLL